MDAFLVSTVAVAIGELGDKTQLLALVLAARYRRPVSIILGIIAATIANHALAGLAGSWLRSTLTTELVRWLVGASFLAIAAWGVLAPPPHEKPNAPQPRGGLLLPPVPVFFFREGGTKPGPAP